MTETDVNPNGVESTPPAEAQLRALGADAKAQALDAIANRVRSAVRRTASNIIEIGGELNNAKGLLDHGKFGPWLDAEFGWSERTARRFMRVADWSVGKTDSVSVLEPTALYLLSAPSTPERAREDVLARLGRGEAMPVESVRTLIDVARAEARQVEEKERTNQRRAAAAERRREKERQARAAEADTAKEPSKTSKAAKPKPAETSMADAVTIRRSASPSENAWAIVDAMGRDEAREIARKVIEIIADRIVKDNGAGAAAHA